MFLSIHSQTFSLWHPLINNYVTGGKLDTYAQTIKDLTLFLRGILVNPFQCSSYRNNPNECQHYVCKKSFGNCRLFKFSDLSDSKSGKQNSVYPDQTADLDIRWCFFFFKSHVNDIGSNRLITPFTLDTSLCLLQFAKDSICRKSFIQFR